MRSKHPDLDITPEEHKRRGDGMKCRIAQGGGMLVWLTMRIISGTEPSIALITGVVVVAVLLLLLAGVLLVEGSMKDR